MFVGYVVLVVWRGSNWTAMQQNCVFGSLSSGMPKLPRVAGFGGFDPPPECLAAWIAGPLRGQKHARAAKCGSRPRDGRTVRDALSLGL